MKERVALLLEAGVAFDPMAALIMACDQRQWAAYEERSIFDGTL